ncbi:MAG TPA: chromosome segregation protein SMC [Deltaproteobacteria bacterium]|nr:chromosome segregation protein SMC [Deltaproteobacteria bacterium]
MAPISAWADRSREDLRIKSLQLHGFKSFVDRTVFSFDEGMTAVVGPNGCGKSNVVDAIKWVMGEQSARKLRGKGMEDVIFAGSENRPPIGMAEVTLTFDNSDGKAPAAFAAYSEIEIARRLYRSGESEYLMNKQPSRLKDVHDFFRDTGIGLRGYTIVEQGKVAEIVSARPEDRRGLIEEAAGISKYKARRREAESKMRSTEQNLVRVNDVLGEIRRQISSLERQARKAARYKRLQETQRILELSLAADERENLIEEVERETAALTALKDETAALQTRLAERELAAQEERIALAEAEKAVTAGAEKLYGLRSEIKNLEGRIDLARRERDSLEEASESRREELAQLGEQLRAAEEELRGARQELELLERGLEQEQSAIEEAEREVQAAQEALRAVEGEREARNAAHVELLTAVARLEDRIAALGDREATIDQQLRGVDADVEAKQSEAARAGDEQSTLEDGLRNLLAERDRLQEQLREAMRQHDRAKEGLRMATLAEQEAMKVAQTTRARFDSLREVVEGRQDLGAGARHLMEAGEEAASRFGLKGLVRELIEADPEVERAVEAVLSDRADAIVIDEADGALAALEALRAEGAGRGVFVVQRSLPDLQGGVVPLGDPLLKRVRPRAGSEGIARTLLGDVYLIDRLETAFKHFGTGRLPATFVTPQGDLATPDGVIQGGGDSSASGVFTRAREVRELEVEVATLDLAAERAQEARARAEAVLARAGEELENLRNRHHTAALAVANHEKDLERSTEKVKRIGEAKESRVAERSELLREQESVAEELVRLQQQLEERRRERETSQRAVDALGLQISSAGRDLSRRESRVAELRVAYRARDEHRQRLRETAARAEQSERETRTWIERRKEEIESARVRREALLGEIENAEAELALRLEAEELARTESEALRERFEANAARVAEVEESARELRVALGRAHEKANQAELKLSEARMRLEHQATTVRERWDIEIADWKLPTLEELETSAEGRANGSTAASASEDHSESRGAATPETAIADPAVRDDSTGSESGDAEAEASPAAALREARRNIELALLPTEERRREAEKVRKSLQSLGDVNLGAIEEHEELAERFRFLSEQKDDLEGTIQSLREAISRINRTSRKRFRETFELVREHFESNFPRLFGGGKASLELTEAEDILDAGVDIMAMPPGKRLQNVNLLSGGEKTMTALALLVAVFQVRPSPFFLLDEVDAALDDANVGRFNQLITEMSEHSQFLVITHNKRTIEVADVLYGVTMEQKGVSKLVSVVLS